MGPQHVTSVNFSSEKTSKSRRTKMEYQEAYINVTYVNFSSGKTSKNRTKMEYQEAMLFSNNKNMLLIRIGCASSGRCNLILM
jgi:hypothetical protein